MNAGNGIQVTGDKIRIADPDLKSALIVPGKHCILTVSGRKVSSPIQIAPEDDVTWRGAHETDPPFEFKVTADRLQVQLTVYADCYDKWAASLERKKERWIVNCSPEPDPNRPVRVDDIIRQYRARRFQAVLDRSAVEQALDEKAGTPVVIARGIPATKGKNGWVEPHFALDEEVEFETTGNRINFREKRRIPILRAGDLMATVHPPTPGKPGTDVWGHPIPPAPARPAKYRLKQNVREDNGKIYAKITGRPSMTREVSPVLDVVSVYTVPGDVDLTFGHVRFEGDVIVLGNILESMKVTATQRIIVHGGVYGAELAAGGSVHVDQTISNSKVYAGQRGTLARKLQQPLKKLYRHVMSVEKSRQQLESEAKKQQKTVLQTDILYHLLTRFYPDTTKQIKTVLNLLDTANKGLLPNEFIPVKESLERLVEESKSRFRLATWQSVRDELQRFLHETLATCLQKETLTLQTADVSELEVHGDIVFTGKGSTHSHMSASERILFTKPNASCRGGSLTAGKRIVAENLGSLSGSKTVCRAGKRIAAKSIQHCDIQIEGPVQYVEDMTDIEFYKDKDQTRSRPWT